MVTASLRDVYNSRPCAEPVGGKVLSGWAILAERASGSRVIAVDGPQIAPWGAFLECLRAAIDKRGSTVCVVDARDGMAAWETILAETSSSVLPDDPDFERLPTASLPDLFHQPVWAEPDAGCVTIIAGPGAALSAHDALWYVDYPQAACRSRRRCRHRAQPRSA